MPKYKSHKIKSTRSKRNSTIRKRKTVKQLANKQLANKQLVNKQLAHKPITNYRGMWKPKPKSFNKMKKDEMIRQINSFIRAWETVTTRGGTEKANKNDDVKSLRNFLEIYYSDEMKLTAEDWLRDKKFQ
jgi:hypothetical protein